MKGAPSQKRIAALVLEARVGTGLSAEEIAFSRFRSAVRARHGIWRVLRAEGFAYKAIARAWGVDHTTVHYALNGKPSQPLKRLAA